jgi:hypothetical protein
MVVLFLLKAHTIMDPLLVIDFTGKASHIFFKNVPVFAINYS